MVCEKLLLIPIRDNSLCFICFVYFFSLPKSDKYAFNFLYVNVFFFCTCYEKNKNIKKKYLFTIFLCISIFTACRTVIVSVPILITNFFKVYFQS